MNHRLFHTLVLSGVALVEGCASAPPPPAAAPTQTAQATAPTIPAETAQAAPAETAPTAPAETAPTADEVRAILADGRACSPGWPTTKSASLTPPRPVVLNGHAYACISRYDRPTQCCLREPAR
jgi:hypothetical protein